MKLDIIENMLDEVKQAESFSIEMLEDAPPEFLRTRCQGSEVRYYKRTVGETDGKYIGYREENVIKALEEKLYYMELLKTARKEKNILEKIRTVLSEMPDYRSVFLGIPLEKRHLIQPYEYSPKKVEDIVRLFNKKPVSEDIKLVTQNGEHVRSKSELVIADRLKASGVPYYYEDPLIIPESNDAYTRCFYWHPDFRVQNVKTGKQYFWEHFGMLDNSEYCDFCQKKLEVYAKSGYFPGENLIITSESSNHVLNMEYVDLIIDRYLK